MTRRSRPSLLLSSCAMLLREESGTRNTPPMFCHLSRASYIASNTSYVSSNDRGAAATGDAHIISPVPRPSCSGREGHSRRRTIRSECLLGRTFFPAKKIFTRNAHRAEKTHIDRYFATPQSIRFETDLIVSPPLLKVRPCSIKLELHVHGIS